MPVIRTLRARLLRAHRDERGQVLMMFVGITMLFFVIGVVGVDASLWQSQQRTAQKDADASAFAGGYDLLNRTTALDIQNRATQAAGEWLTRNGGNASMFKAGTPLVAGDSTSGCFGPPAFDGLPDSVTVDLGAQGSTLFASIWNLVGANVGAHAKVCVGSPADSEGVLPLGIPIQTSSCFDQSTTPPTPLFGQTCDIEVRAPDGSTGETGVLQLCDDPNTGCPNNHVDCSDKSIAISNAELQQQIAYGANTACASDAPAGTPPDCNNVQVFDSYGIGTCIWSQTGNKAKEVVAGLQTRLSLEGQTTAPYDCDWLYPDAYFGGQYVHDKVDQWWEALSPTSGDIHNVTPGPGVIFQKRDCKAPRVVTLVLLDQFPTQGQCTACLIRGFAGFFITGCRDTNGNFNQRCVTQQAFNQGVPNPTGEPLLSNTGQLNMEGMFINYVDVGEHGGALNRFGRIQLFLVE